MKSVTFAITEHEVRDNAEKRIGDSEMNEVLAFIENDFILWEHIQDSIRSAISHVFLLDNKTKGIVK